MSKMNLRSLLWLLFPALLARACLATSPRLEINELFQDDKSRNLFLLSLKSLQDMPTDKYSSYFQISGIHGYPAKLYRGSENPNMTLEDILQAQEEGDDTYEIGYCVHRFSLFPTWHRAYMLLMESALRNESLIIAEKFQDLAQRREYVTRAKNFMMPYWDWTAKDVQKYGLPDFLTDQTVRVLVPPGNTPRRIPNPLARYISPENVGIGPLECDSCNPYDKPFNPENSTEWIPAGYGTVRHPNEKYQTNVVELNKAMRMESGKELQDSVLGLLAIRKSWDQFASTGILGGGSSLESIHDRVHMLVGGDGGQMANTAMAAFDPIFYLHHGFMEYIFSLYQELYPDIWVTPSVTYRGTLTIAAGSTIDAQTPLTPFRTGDGSPSNPYYISDDLRNISDLGYTYKLIDSIRGKTLDEKREAILSRFGNDQPMRYHLSFQNATYTNLKNPVSIEVYFGDPAGVKNAQGKYSPYYTGSLAVWGVPPLSGTVDGSVDITDEFLAVGDAVIDPSYVHIKVLSTSGEDYTSDISGLDTIVINSLNMSSGKVENIYQQDTDNVLPGEQCAYKGIYRIHTVDGPCRGLYVASGTDDDCSDLRVTLRSVGRLGRKWDRIKWSIDQNPLDDRTTVVSMGRSECVDKYLDYNTTDLSLATGGPRNVWRMVPIKGSSACDEVNIFSLRRYYKDEEAPLLKVSKSCDFGFTEDSQRAQKFKLVKV